MRKHRSRRLYYAQPGVILLAGMLACQLAWGSPLQQEHLAPAQYHLLPMVQTFQLDSILPAWIRTDYGVMLAAILALVAGSLLYETGQRVRRLSGGTDNQAILLPRILFDLRTALMDIMGYAELVRITAKSSDSAADRRASEYAIHILTGSGDIKKMIDGLPPGPERGKKLLREMAFHMRTALTGIMGFAQLMRGRTGSQGVSVEYAGHILTGAENILKLFGEGRLPGRTG